MNTAEVLDVVARYVGKHSTIYGYIRDDLAAHPRTEPTDEAVAEFRRFLNAQKPVDGKITMKQARHILRAWPAAQPRTDAAQQGEVVVTRLGSSTGPIVAVTRQDGDGRILSVIAEATPPSAPVGVETEVQARESVALALDEAGYPAEADNVRNGIDLDDYRVELSIARIALAQQLAADCTCPHQDAREPDHDVACPARLAQQQENGNG